MLTCTFRGYTAKLLIRKSERTNESASICCCCCFMCGICMCVCVCMSTRDLFYLDDILPVVRSLYPLMVNTPSAIFCVIKPIPKCILHCTCTAVTMCIYVHSLLILLLLLLLFCMSLYDLYYWFIFQLSLTICVVVSFLFSRVFRPVCSGFNSIYAMLCLLACTFALHFVDTFFLFTTPVHVRFIGICKRNWNHSTLLSSFCCFFLFLSFSNCYCIPSCILYSTRTEISTLLWGMHEMSNTILIESTQMALQ